MQIFDENLFLLPPTDLADLLGCRHATVEASGNGFNRSRENRGTQDATRIGQNRVPMYG
jgi:hypothetical protein